MRFFLALGVAALTACGNTYHPEYHPQSSFSYSQNVSSPVVVKTGTPQPVYVTPSPAPPSVAQLPAPPPPPQPPADWPW